jgi:hypothetical protein
LPRGQFCFLFHAACFLLLPLQAPAAKDTAKTDSSWKQHQSPISTMSLVNGPTTLATTAMDGRLVVWDLTKSKVPKGILGL